MDWSKIIYEIEDKIPLSGSLATILGVRYQYISDLKTGKTKIPNGEFVLSLIKNLNINPDWLKGESDEIINLKNTTSSEKPAILQELEKMAKEAAKETIEEQEQELIRMKMQLENLIQEREYLKQEERLAKVENRQEELDKIYREMYDLYYNTPKETKPKRVIRRSMGSKGIITEKQGILYPDGTFIEDSKLPEEVKEPAPLYTAAYEEPEETIDLPLAQNLAAGIPVEASDVNDTFPVPKKLIPNKRKKYCVAKIKGSSMTEAGIENGSCVLLEYTDQPIDGEIMVVSYNSNTTLKLLHQNIKGEWELLYRDGSGAKIELKNGDWEVKGRFVAVLPKKRQ
ncbi:S24 family peptidase [Treponema denticola]|uniref:S24 family peptidase n=1 Tax=Treponema denticola TaxID=158 RepID=UPI0020A3AE84|nr:S24 family peptidase [Treponema denticola]